MGDVGAATDPDVVSQYWNPAKYPFNISRAGVAINYTPWLRQLVSDIDLAYVAGYYRIGDYSAVSASLRYFSLGEVQMLDDDNLTINPYEMSFDVAYSLMLSENFSLGAAVRWIYSDLTYDFTSDTAPGSAFAADLSCYYQNYLNIGQRECQLGLGLNISNIGSKISFGGDNNSEFIPTNMRLGASLMVPIDEYNRLLPTLTSCWCPPTPNKTRAKAPKLTKSVCRKIIMTYRQSAASLRALAMPLAALKKSCRRYSGAWVLNISTTISLRCVPDIITSRRTKVTANTLPWALALR